MSATFAPPAELTAPAAWRTVDFISDLHLQASEPETLAAWQRYMAQTRAEAIFILGDLFEVWIGDDCATPSSFEHRCLEILRTKAQHCAVFFMHGNRDFLLGEDFAQACGITLLVDPTVLNFSGQRWLLSHGDELCLDDHDYLLFRSQVRSRAWQQEFLAKPLSQRLAIALDLRQQSEARKRGSLSYADVDADEVARWLAQARSKHLIHGHTHKPADHQLAAGLRRSVLSDWDGRATPARTQVLRLSLTPDSPHSGIVLQRISTDLA